MKAFLRLNVLPEKIKRENKFEIKPATSQERIQKKIKFDLSWQLMQASVNVIKNVVIKFLKIANFLELRTAIIFT